MIKKIIAALVVFFVGFVILINGLILSYAADVVPADITPPRLTALVFGGGMKAPGVMSPMLEDRVAVGVQLYRAGKVAKIVMTGDDGANRRDEITAMKTFAIQQGVPSKDIYIDPHGYRTYDSCYRQKNVYGATSTLVISQNFHLSRILYLCQSLGLKSIGISADLHSYGSDATKAGVREIFARVKAWLDITVLHPKPRTLEK